jgi:microcystin-dependent protein
MNIFFKRRFCLILFAFSFNMLLAQVTDALIVTPEGNVNVPNGKVQEKGNDLLPKGAIILWYGTTVPAGWAICDGKNGTPDLQGRFVVGVGSNGESNYNLGDTSGQDKPKIGVNQLPAHTHKVEITTTQDGYHEHSYTLIDPTGYEETKEARYGGKYWGPKSESKSTSWAGAHTHKVTGSTEPTGSGEKFDNRPKYYALYYIMKL